MGEQSCLVCEIRINTDSVFIGLKSTSHLFAQIQILVRSEFRQTADVHVAGFLIIIKRLVLSANSRILEPISATMSLI